MTLALVLQGSILLAQMPKHLEGKMTYPVFDFSPWVGVVESDAKVLKYNKKLDYKIVIDVTDKVSDSTRVMNTLNEVARSYNLNIANGVPQKKLKMAVVVHGSAIYGILNDEAYEKKFGVPNPNREVLDILKKEGIELYVCSQLLSFRNIPHTDVLPSVDVAVSAKTALISLDQMGYTYMNVNDN